MRRRPPELVVDFTKTIDIKMESDSNFKHLKKHIESKKAKAAAETGEEATFDFQAESRVVGELKTMIKQWEVAVYKSDKDRWKSYATDVSHVLSKYENTTDHANILADLKTALNSWEHATYPSDSNRWESYAGDISSLISKHGSIS